MHVQINRPSNTVLTSPARSGTRSPVDPLTFDPICSPGPAAGTSGGSSPCGWGTGAPGSRGPASAWCVPLTGFYFLHSWRKAGLEMKCLSPTSKICLECIKWLQFSFYSKSKSSPTPPYLKKENQQSIVATYC